MDAVVIGKRWRLGRRLRERADGAVYHATDLLTRGSAAVKLAQPAYPHGAGQPAALAREYRILRRLRHPATATPLDYGATERHATFLVLEYLDGPTLARVLRAEGPLPIAEALALAEQIADAVDAAHALGVAHGRIAPRHVVRCAGDDGVRRWKLLDFAHAAGADAPAADGCAAVASDAARRADLVALAALAYEALVGVPPPVHAAPRRPGASAAAPRPCPPAVMAVLEAGLDPAAPRPPGSAGEFARRLRLASGQRGAASFADLEEIAMERPLSLRERAVTPPKPIAVGPGARPQRSGSATVSWDNVAAAAAPPEEIVLHIKLSHAIIAVLAVVAATGMAFLILRG